MPTKWKVLIASIIIYQLVLTLVVLKLAQYSQSLYFPGEIGITQKWYEGGVTVPMAQSLLTLGILFVALLLLNLLVFRSKENKSSGESQNQSSH